MVCRMLFEPHENATSTSKRELDAFLTGPASARERKSLLDSASMYQVKA